MQSQAIYTSLEDIKMSFKCQQNDCKLSINLIYFFLILLGIIVHQESVCATFGSGLSSACIVDVGDQKTSVCCVEDGVSHRNTRYLRVCRIIIIMLTKDLTFKRRQNFYKYRGFLTQAFNRVNCYNMNLKVLSLKEENRQN